MRSEQEVTQAEREQDRHAAHRSRAPVPSQDIRRARSDSPPFDALPGLLVRVYAGSRLSFPNVGHLRR